MIGWGWGQGSPAQKAQYKHITALYYDFVVEYVGAYGLLITVHPEEHILLNVALLCTGGFQKDIMKCGVTYGLDLLFSEQPERKNIFQYLVWSSDQTDMAVF